MLSDSEHKMCVVVLFGGMSSEHEVSRVSAGTFVDQLDRQRYELLTIGITKEGRWLYTEADSAQMADGSWEELPGNMPCVLSPDRADHGLILFTPAGQVEKVHVDVVIPVLHGRWGEDGTVQGLLELAGIPYVGCGVLASAVCMDKAVANAMFDASGIPHTKWLSATRWEIESDPDGVCDGVIAKLGWPIFVKPAIASAIMGGAAWAVYGLLSRVLTAEQVNEAGETIRVVSRMGNALGIFLAIAVAGVVYLVLVVAIRAISKDDLALMPKGDKLARLLRL